MTNKVTNDVQIRTPGGSSKDASSSRVAKGGKRSSPNQPETAAAPEEEVTSGQRPCEVCGNTYDKAITVVLNGESHVFDCFECAIHALAPICCHCECRIIGHGMESKGEMFCCAHCAEVCGVDGLKGRT